MRLPAALLFATALVGCGQGQSETEKNRVIIEAFAKDFYDQRDVKRAFETYVAEDYIQHNPGIADGRAAAIAALEPMFSREGAHFDIKHIVVDGDMAVIHLHGQGKANDPGGAVADIYRLHGGKIVEHWDILQPIEPSTVNPHPYF